MGMTFRIGRLTTSTLGLLLMRQPLSISQSAPSRYSPDTKQPEEPEEAGLYAEAPAILLRNSPKRCPRQTHTERSCVFIINPL